MTFHRTYHYRHKTHHRPKATEELDASISLEQRAGEVFFCGDPHGSFDHIIQAGKEYRPKAMIILGDLQPPAPLHEVLQEILPFVQVWWIPGNHDTDNDYFYDRLWRSELAGHNLHGRVAVVNGIRIAGLGGVFRGQIWMPPQAPNYMSAGAFIRRIGRGNMWRGGLPRRHRTSIFPSTYDNLLTQKADVLITHEAPGCHRKGFLAIDQLAKTMQVKYLFHGHQHEDRHYPTYYGFTPRGVGYRGIVNLLGEDIVPAQIDPREVLDYAETSFDATPISRFTFKRLG